MPYNLELLFGKFILFGKFPVVRACEDIQPADTLAVIKVDSMQKLSNPSCPAVIELLKHMSALTVPAQRVIYGVQSN